ncbi:MAG: hypothetical protein QOH12_1447 [Solirubrobacteraceae bacterium]|jgi:hypothetical protein|nr:hypothetical protein [Solirubrobacteraceae bacterium]
MPMLERTVSDAPDENTQAAIEAIRAALGSAVETQDLRGGEGSPGQAEATDLDQARATHRPREDSPARAAVGSGWRGLDPAQPAVSTGGFSSNGMLSEPRR